MQGFTGGQPPTGALPPTQGVPQVATPPFPQGLTPSITQQPAAPMAAFHPSGGFGSAPPTYPGGQPYTRVPGPSTLGPAPDVPGQMGTGGVPGVSMAPVGTVAPPAGPGGPHPLPSLPQAPLPQGFPNPFALQQLQQGVPGPAPAPAQQTVTGPMGYMPGLGYFPGPQQAPAGSPPPTAFPSLPGAIPPQAPPPQFAPLQQYAPPQQPPQAPPQALGAQNPFWLQLSWQLANTPAVKAALGDRFDPLVLGDDRVRTISAGAACLAGQELQGALQALGSGRLDQARFTELFADALRKALR